MTRKKCKKCNQKLYVFEDHKEGICMPCIWENKNLLSDAQKKNYLDEIKMMRKNTNNKLRLAAKVHLLKYYEIMVHLKKIEKGDLNVEKN